MKCHQRVIREHQAEIEHKQNLFGAYWENIDLSRQNAKVQEVSYSMAKEIILKYEWLGTMPVGQKFAYGLFFGWPFAAVECFTDSKAGSLYTFNKEPALCLARGACVHWAPKWAASFLISNAIKYINSIKYKYVLAYSDTDANEIGTVYQACNWYCVGKVENIFWKSPNGARFDRCYHRDLAKEKIAGKNKVIGDKHNDIKKQLIEKGWVLKRGGVRYKYVFPIGTGKDFRQRRKYLESIAIPYPKREQYGR